MSDNDSPTVLAETSPLSLQSGARPPPIPPKPPVAGECCERGCELCVWVYYQEAVRRYEMTAAEWQRRHENPA